MPSLFHRILQGKRCNDTYNYITIATVLHCNDVYVYRMLCKIKFEIAQDCFTQHIGPSDRRRSSRGVPFRDKASHCMLKPTWRSQQKREEQAEAEAEAEAATAVAAAEPDFDTGQAEAYEEQGSDVADEDIDRARADDASPIAEPESEPDSEHREAKAQRKEGADDKCSDEDSAEDGALPVVLPQVSRPSLEEYKEKWSRLLAQHSKPVEGEYSIGNLVPTPIHQLWQDCPYVPFDELKSEEAQSRLSVCQPISGLTETTRAGGVERYAHNSGEVPRRSYKSAVMCLKYGKHLAGASARPRTRITHPLHMSTHQTHTRTTHPLTNAPRAHT